VALIIFRQPRLRSLRTAYPGTAAAARVRAKKSSRGGAARAAPFVPWFVSFIHFQKSSFSPSRVEPTIYSIIIILFNHHEVFHVRLLSCVPSLPIIIACNYTGILSARRMRAVRRLCNGHSELRRQLRRTMVR
jgi:hypothetical protein